MNSIITRGLDNKIKKRKSPRNLSLKNEYKEFLRKSKKHSSKKKTKKSPSFKKKIKITANKKDPVFIKTNTVAKSPKKNKKVEPKKVEPKKVEPKKVEPKKVEPKKVEPKKVEVKSKTSISKKRRFTKKSKRRKLDKKHTKSRKISFRCYPQKEKNINDVMKKANKMSEEEMKKELLSNGIEIKGSKNKLLKDIYMFSSLGGIKIQKE
jgi:hypothetical protein